MTIAIGICTLLLIIPAIRAAIARKPNLGLARSQVGLGTKKEHRLVDN
ncbi:hypothetical protein [Nostoc sp.]